MDISINGEKADIILENEKTVGDILTGLDKWLSAPGAAGNKKPALRLSGLVIDGRTIGAETLESSFALDLATIQKIDITVSSLHELLYAMLMETREAVQTWGNIDYADRRKFAENWGKSPAMALLPEQYPEIADAVLKTISGEGPDAQVLTAVIDERLRELENPAAELGAMEKIIADTVQRLENLPLDMQTGNDRKALETIQIFTGVTEKIFRIFYILKTDNSPSLNVPLTVQFSDNTADGNDCGGNSEIPIEKFFTDFNGALGEMLTAYEHKDIVLVGDMAEYEMAPRLRSFYTAMKKTCR